MLMNKRLNLLTNNICYLVQRYWCDSRCLSSVLRSPRCTTSKYVGLQSAIRHDFQRTVWQGAYPVDTEHVMLALYLVASVIKIVPHEDILTFKICATHRKTVIFAVSDGILSNDARQQLNLYSNTH
jgi:hypothetical protein